MLKKIIYTVLMMVLMTAAVARPADITVQPDQDDTAKSGYLDRQRRQILKKIITKNLPRDIRVGAMEPFFFGLQGARIDRFKMTENEEFLKNHPDVDPIFIDAENVLVRINPLMLLLGQVFIEEMRIQAPRYQIIHDKNGNFNFDDLSEAQDSKLLKWLRIKELSVNDGRYLVFDDSALDNPVTYTVSDVDIRVNDFTIGQVFNLDIKAASPGSTVQNIFFSGQAGPMGLNQKNEQIPIDADLSMVNLPILPYLGYSFPADSPAKPISGLINVDFHITGDAWSGMTMTGGLRLSEVVFRSGDGTVSGQPISLGIYLREPIVVCLRDDIIAMSALDMMINDNRFTLSGKLTNLKGLSQVNARLETNGMNVDVLTSAYPFILNSFPDLIRLGGNFSMDVNLAGSQLDALLEGRLDLTGLEIGFADYFRKPSQAPLSMTFTARANTSELVEGAGSFKMENFLLGHYNFIEDVLKRLLADAVDQKGKEALLARYRRLPHTIEKISGNAAYQADRARITDIRIVNLKPEAAPGLNAVLNGTVDFSDGSLDIKGDIIISPGLSRRIVALAPGTASYLSNGAIVIGFQHTGTIDDFDLEIFPRAIRLPAGTAP